MSIRSIAALAFTQWVLSIGTVTLVAVLTGSWSAGAPAIAMLAGAALWASVRARRHGWMSRDEVRWLTPRVGAAHALIGATCYSALLASFPEAFADVEPGAAVLAGALFGGLGGLVLTLCGVNAVNMEWGAFNGREA